MRSIASRSRGNARATRAWSVLAFSPQLDAVVLMVSEDRTRRDDVQRLFELLRATPVVGTVLNASSEAEERIY